MSVAHIETELETLSLEELRAVEEAARRQQWHRRARVLDEVESRLFHVINEPLPAANGYWSCGPNAKRARFWMKSWRN